MQLPFSKAHAPYSSSFNQLEEHYGSYMGHTVNAEFSIPHRSFGAFQKFNWNNHPISYKNIVFMTRKLSFPKEVETASNKFITLIISIEHITPLPWNNTRIDGEKKETLE